MKWMIASDIHGSAACCRRLLEAFHGERAEKLLLLGDLLYHGARNDLPEEYDTRKTAALLNGERERLLCVRGNCDSEVDQMVLEFPILAEYALLYLDGVTFFAVHGHHTGPDALPPVPAGTVLLSGHTHVPDCREKDGILLLNPGSVSIPKGGSRAGYLLYEDRRFVWKTLTGEICRDIVLP